MDIEPSDEQEDRINKRLDQINEHDYDPRWDYDIDYNNLDHPLQTVAQQRMDELAAHPETQFERGHVFPVKLDLSKHHKDAIGVYCSGTYNEPVVLVDIGKHDSIDVADPEDEIRRTVDHEVAHSMQEHQNGGETDNWGDEDDAEGRRFESSESDRWHQGFCGEYAAALQRQYPHLRIGWTGGTEPHDDDDSYYINHVFAHDDNHAYDNFGKHPLDGKLYGDEGVRVLNQSTSDLKDNWDIDDWETDSAAEHLRTVPSSSLPTDYLDSREAAATQNKLIERSKDLPDQSEVLHEWPDGWSIRQPKTFLDHHREGVLMSNCYDANHPDRHWLWNQYEPDTVSTPPNNMGWTEYIDQEMNKPATRLHGDQVQTYSLRDPDNIPHMTVDPESINAGVASNPWGALGRHNSEPKPEYLNRWKESLKAQAENVLPKQATADWYHVAPKAYRESILKNGIQPNQQEGFSGSDFGDHLYGLQGHEQPVYLTKNPNFVGIDITNDPSDYDVWKVKPQKPLLADAGSLIEHGFELGDDDEMYPTKYTNSNHPELANMFPDDHDLTDLDHPGVIDYTGTAAHPGGIDPEHIELANHQKQSALDPSNPLSSPVLYDPSGWQPGTQGKGYVSPDGAEHWSVDDNGSPHHADIISLHRPNDRTGIPPKRFDIDPDGKVHPMGVWNATGEGEEFDNDDWNSALNSHPNFYKGETKDVGFGHAQNILDNLKQSAETTQQLVERLRPNTNKIVAQHPNGWTIQQPQVFGDLDAIGSNMGNCWGKGHAGWDHNWSQHPDWPAGDEAGYFYKGKWDPETMTVDDDGYEIADANHPLFQNLDPTVQLPDPSRYWSLHDPSGVPRLAYDEDSHDEILLGRHNSEPKPEYKQIWDELKPQIQNKHFEASQSAATKQSAETTQQLVERLRPNTNKIVAQHPNGWSVQQPTTFADLDAIGDNMGTCWEHTLDNENLDMHYTEHPDWPADLDWSDDRVSDEHINQVENLDLNKPLWAEGSRYKALYDPHGIPRLGYDSATDDALLGRHNSEPKPEYQQIWDELEPQIWPDDDTAESSPADLEAIHDKWPNLEVNRGYYIKDDGSLAWTSWYRAPDGTIADTTQLFSKDIVISPSHPSYDRYVSYEHEPEQAMAQAHRAGHHKDPEDYKDCPECSNHFEASMQEAIERYS